MPALTRLQLLGGFALSIGNSAPVALPLKAQALAAVLALREGRPVKREFVSELLWPERGEKQARNSLKQELYILRRDGFAGQSVVVTSQDGALLLPPEHLFCDVYELLAMTRPTKEASWQTITALYVGPLLHGFPPVSPAFDDFIGGMRRSLEIDVLGALGRLADDSAARAEMEQCHAIAERMLAIDPLREDAHRQLIQSYARAGRRADAMRVYSDAKALLRRELDVDPAPETEALIGRIRGGWTAEPSALSTPMTVPAAAGYNGPPRIAVLPLRQFLDKPLASHISDGITADIIGQLAGLRELTVISHGSTFGLSDPNLDTREIERRLNARYVVVCNLYPADRRYRLTTTLTEAETSAVFPPFNDYVKAALSFEDQDRVVARLVNQLNLQVQEAELRRIRGQRPSVLSVYEKILLSREYITLLIRDRFGEAKALLDEVIQEDPGYGEGYALAADWHSAMVNEHWTTDRVEGIAAVERLSKTALSLDHRNLRALVSYAYRRSVNYRDHVGAIRMFDQALNDAPSSANAWALSGLSFAYAGNAAEAVNRTTRALDLSPYDRDIHKFYYALCVALYTLGDYEAAAEWGQRALNEKTVWSGARGYTAVSLAALGRLREAREIAAQMSALAPGRRVNEVVNDLAYQDPRRRKRFGELLAVAGYPE
jgi:DNA-binding SARP family transcriptional activator/TolB-like protein